MFDDNIDNGLFTYTTTWHFAASNKIMQIFIRDLMAVNLYLSSETKQGINRMNLLITLSRG